MIQPKIFIVGKGASGKDFLAEHLVTAGYGKARMHTTRPIRPSEEENPNYIHTIDDFFEVEDIFEFGESAFAYKEKFVGYWYGLTKENFYRCSFVLATPTSLQKMIRKDGRDLVVYIDVNDVVRRERMRQRNDWDSVERRIESDRNDFKDFQISHFNNYLHITKPDFDVDGVVSIIGNFLFTKSLKQKI